MKYSIVNKVNPGKVFCTEGTLVEFTDVICKKSWAPGVFKNSTRNIQSLESIGLLVLDVDSGATIEQAKELFQAYWHIIGTTKSHQIEKNGTTCDRFRVILRLDKSVTDDLTFKSTWDTAQKSFPFIDPACKDSSRMFYPCVELIDVGQGVPFPVKDYVAPVKEATVVNTAEKGELWKETLKFLQFGAEPGNWHTQFIKAAMNMREQGYEYDEAHEMLDKIDRPLDTTDEKQLRDCFTRPVKYPYQPKEETQQIAIRAIDLVNETYDYLSDKEKVKGESTGIDKLDAMLGGGFRHGEITVLMAEAKTGKNSLYHSLIHGMIKRGLGIGYASRELDPAREVIPNLLSIEFKENYWKVDLNEKRRNQANGFLSSSNLWFAPGYGYFPLVEIEKWLVELTSKGIKQFWMDHLHYMLEEEDHKIAARFMKELKTLAKRMDVHINLIVQPTKVLEGMRLSLGSIKGGSAVGQALDNLLILERVRDQKNISKLTLEVGRHKLCNPGHIHLAYNSETTTFEEAVVIEHEPEYQRPQGYSGNNSNFNNRFHNKIVVNNPKGSN